MRTGVRFILSSVVILVLLNVSTARAQSQSWGEVSVTTGLVNYDLSGVGNTSGVAIRTAKSVTPHVSLELRGLLARPCQQFQPCDETGPATLFVPEAQLQYRWNAGRLEPFVGAGLGLSALKSSVHTEWDPVVSFATGTAVRLTDRLALTGELRLRGHEWRFTGSTSEINFGVSWRLPRF